MDGLRAIDPGLLATVQDAGRYGWQRFGVVVAGAMDLAAYRTANALVGNDADAAAVELTLTGGRWEIAGQPRRVAVTGAEFAIAVDGRPVPAWCSFVLRAGEPDHRPRAGRRTRLSRGLRRDRRAARARQPVDACALGHRRPRWSGAAGG